MPQCRHIVFNYTKIA